MPPELSEVNYQPAPVVILFAGFLEPQPAGEGHEVLACCPYFLTESLRIHRERAYRYDRPHLLILLEGQGAFGDLACRAGEVWLGPADSEFTLRPAPALRLLRTSIPAGVLRETSLLNAIHSRSPVPRKKEPR